MNLENPHFFASCMQWLSADLQCSTYCRLKKKKKRWRKKNHRFSHSGYRVALDNLLHLIIKWSNTEIELKRGIFASFSHEPKAKITETTSNFHRHSSSGNVHLGFVCKERRGGAQLCSKTHRDQKSIKADLWILLFQLYQKLFKCLRAAVSIW